MIDEHQSEFLKGHKFLSLPNKNETRRIKEYIKVELQGKTKNSSDAIYYEIGWEFHGLEVGCDILSFLTDCMGLHAQTMLTFFFPFDDEGICKSRIKKKKKE